MTEKKIRPPFTKGLNSYTVYVGSLDSDTRPHVDARTPEAADRFIRRSFKLMPDMVIIVIDRHTGEVLLETGQPGLSQPAPESGGRKGRPLLNIGLNLICDALKNSENVKQAAASLGCSRGYIYKVVPAEKVRELVRL